MPPTWSLHDHTARTVLGTFLSLARAHAAAIGVEVGHEWAVWECADATSDVGKMVDEGIGPLRDPLSA